MHAFCAWNPAATPSLNPGKELEEALRESTRKLEQAEQERSGVREELLGASRQVAALRERFAALTSALGKRETEFQRGQTREKALRTEKARQASQLKQLAEHPDLTLALELSRTEARDLRARVQEEGKGGGKPPPRGGEVRYLEEKMTRGMDDRRVRWESGTENRTIGG